MDVTIVSRFKSQRGNNAIVVEGHKFTEYRTMEDGSLSFRCYNRKCSVTLCTDSNINRVLSMRNDHNHPPPSEQQLERQQLCTSLKRKAMDELHTKPNKLIRKELKTSNSSNLEYSDLKLIQQTMYTARRKVLPTVPSSLNDALSQLTDIQHTLTVSLERFCYKNDGDHIPIFTTRKHLHLLAQAEHIIVDSTFSYAPKCFLQLYTVHAYVKGFHVPVAHGFLTSKITENYKQFWLNLRHLCLTLTKVDLCVQVAHLDFEICAHNAIRVIFPDCTIYGCLFHLAQAWFRRIQRNKRWLKHFKKKTEVGMWCKMFFGLPFLPPEAVYNAFTTLMEQAPLEGHDFSYYVLTNYIEHGCLFPPSIWASPPPTTHLRTTNCAESFRADYNRQFYAPHPNLHVVISALKEIWAEAALKIASIDKGTTNVLRKETRNKLDFLMKCWVEYDEGKDILEYLTVATRNTICDAEQQ